MALVVGAICLFTRWKRLAKTLVVVSTAILFLIGGTPLSRMLIAHLESYYTSPVLPETVDGIILLGGNFHLAESTARGMPVHNLAASRLYETLPLMRRYPSAKIYFSGTPLEASLSKDVLVAHGIDETRLVLDYQARNTKDNADNITKMVAPKEGENWVLVTSAFHMLRSVKLFEQRGWKVIPYPVDFHTSGKGWRKDHFFSFDRLAWVAWAVGMKEVAGLVQLK